MKLDVVRQALAAALLSGLYLMPIPSDAYVFVDLQQGSIHTFGINASGTVAFTGTVNSTNGLYTATGTSTNLLTPSSNYVLGLNFGGSFNDAGTATFLSWNGVSGSDRIWTSNLGGTAQVAGTSAVVNTAPAINNAGVVAYATSNGTFINLAGAVTSVAPLANTLDINASGQVALATQSFIPNPGYAINGTLIAPYELYGTGSFLSINDSGVVAFSSSTGIFTGQVGSVTTVATTAGVFSSLGNNPSINAAGTVTFLGGTASGDSAIYLASQAGVQRLVGVGDSLFGSTVVNVSTTSYAINDTGQVAFRYVLADGREGIARADPTGVPGMTPDLPILPPGDVGGGDTRWIFPTPVGRRWYDPILAYGYEYVLTGDGSFLEVQIAPGFNNLSIVIDGIVVDSDFDAGESFFFTPGVNRFSLTGISVDGSDPAAFPTFLDWIGLPTELQMTALVGPTVDIPEPPSLLLLLGGLFAAAATGRRRTRESMTVDALPQRPSRLGGFGQGRSVRVRLG